MKYTQTLFTALAMLALVSAVNSADTTKTVAKVGAVATKPGDTATPAEVAKFAESKKVVDTTKAKTARAPKVKKTEPKADTAKTAAGKPSVTGGKSCDEVKSAIEEKIKANGVANPILTVTPAADVKDGKVVGSCGGGSKKIVYTKG